MGGGDNLKYETKENWRRSCAGGTQNKSANCFLPTLYHPGAGSEKKNESLTSKFTGASNIRTQNTALATLLAILCLACGGAQFPTGSAHFLMW